MSSALGKDTGVLASQRVIKVGDLFSFPVVVIKYFDESNVREKALI